MSFASPLGPGRFFPAPGQYNAVGYLLDTSQASALAAGVSTTEIKIVSLDSDLIVATCAPVFGELTFGAYKSRRKRENLQRLEGLARRVVVLPITSNIAHVYGIIKHALFERYAPKEKKRRDEYDVVKETGISDNDILIAAVALYHRLIVVTDDRTDFEKIRRVTGLPFERWN
jgi:tRNA(fMet)-specific endonuclease VapC